MVINILKERFVTIVTTGQALSMDKVMIAYDSRSCPNSGYMSQIEPYARKYGDKMAHHLIGVTVSLFQTV